MSNAILNWFEFTHQIGQVMACKTICRMLENLTGPFSDLKPRVSSRGATYGEGRGLEEETVSNLTVGQFVLCHWSDGLYYLGKIHRVTYTHACMHVCQSVLITSDSVL